MNGKPYSRGEIEAFASTNLKIVEIGDPAEQDALRRRFVDIIEVLPPWQQVLLIEYRGNNIIADGDSVSRLWRQVAANSPIKQVNGFFNAGSLRLNFNNHSRGYAVRDPIIVSRDARDEYHELTVRHEDGHRVDAILAGSDPDCKVWFYSSHSPAWKEALAQDIAARQAAAAKVAPVVTSRNPLSWLVRRLGQIAGGLKDEGVSVAPLYEGYRDLADHLALYGKNTDSTHENEAFAEISNHYDTLYARHNGNERIVGKIMAAHYPALWAQYSETIIPKAQALADDLMEKRNKTIQSILERSRKLYELSGHFFEESQEVAELKIIAARGALERTERRLFDLTRFYRNPVEVFVDKRMDMEELRWDLATNGTEKYRQPFVFDREKEEESARAYIADKGVDALAIAYNDLTDEHNTLKHFVTAEVGFAQNSQRIYTDINGKVHGDVDGFDILRRFDRLREEGGLKAARDYADGLPAKALLTKYINARENYEEQRASMRNNGKSVLSPYDEAQAARMSEEIRALYEQGGTELVYNETERLKAESKALTQLELRMYRTAEALGRAVGVEPPYDRESDILAKFDALIAEGGPDVVTAFSDRVRIGYKQAYNYALAREHEIATAHEIERYGKEASFNIRAGLYQPFEIAAKDMPRNFARETILALQNLLLEGGEAAVVAETRRMAQETHNLIVATLQRNGQPVRGAPRPLAQGSDFGG